MPPPALGLIAAGWPGFASRPAVSARQAGGPALPTAGARTSERSPAGLPPFSCVVSHLAHATTPHRTAPSRSLALCWVSNRACRRAPAAANAPRFPPLPAPPRPLGSHSFSLCAIVPVSCCQHSRQLDSCKHANAWTGSITGLAAQTWKASDGATGYVTCPPAWCHQLLLLLRRRTPFCGLATTPHAGRSWSSSKRPCSSRVTAALSDSRQRHVNAAPRALQPCPHKRRQPTVTCSGCTAAAQQPRRRRRRSSWARQPRHRCRPGAGGRELPAPA